MNNWAGATSAKNSVSTQRSHLQKSGLMLIVMLVLASGCSILRTPQKVVQAVVPGESDKQPDPATLQIQIQRFTDDFISRTTQALDDYAQRMGTERSRLRALRLKLTTTTSLIAIASGPNPNINLLDTVSVSTLTRMIVEDYWMKTPEGPAFQSWLENSRILETNAWTLAAMYLKPAQLTELHEAITRWYAKNPELREGFMARPHEFASMLRSKERRAGADSVFNLVGLDPTVGLDPAVREITKTRLFAERTMFYVQRMPFLMRWQIELLADDLTALPELRQVVTNSTQIADSIGRMSRTAAELPELITEERKAILAALEQQEGKLRELTVEVNRTLVSGEKMSTSLNTTLITFDELMKRFGVGEPVTNAVPTDTNSPPFNILDYGKVADQISGAAKELNVLLTSANQSVTQLTRLSDEATAKVDRAVDHVFRRGVQLVLILLAGAVLAGLVYRIFVKKVARD